MATTLHPAHLAFALRTHAALRDRPRDGDLLWSPYSVSAALGMVSAGARGRTREELADYLAPGSGLDDLLDRVRGAAELDDDGGGSGLTVVNTLWARPDLPVEPAYEGTLRGMPGGTLRTADFGRDPGGAARAINEDVAKTTRGLIDAIVDRQAVSDAQAVLVNALWVYLAWVEPFEAGRTRPLTFHAPGGDREVPAMRARRTMTYGRAGGWRLVTLPGNGGLALDILLPDDPEAAPPGPDDMARLYDGAGRADVRLALPRFETTYGAELSAVIASLGAPTVFTDQADLSGISPVPLEVDKVLHKARLRVDEAGAEGAAATAVGVRLASMARPRDPVEFTVDRPYLAVLRHLRTGLIYFLAEITDPRDPGPATS